VGAVQQAPAPCWRPALFPDREENARRVAANTLGPLTSHCSVPLTLSCNDGNRFPASLREQPYRIRGIDLGVSGKINRTSGASSGGPRFLMQRKVTKSELFFPPANTHAVQPRTLAFPVANVAHKERRAHPAACFTKVPNLTVLGVGRPRQVPYRSKIYGRPFSSASKPGHLESRATGGFDVFGEAPRSTRTGSGSVSSNNNLRQRYDDGAVPSAAPFSSWKSPGTRPAPIWFSSAALLMESLTMCHS